MHLMFSLLSGNYDGESRKNLKLLAASGTTIFTLLLRRRVAFLHHTATCRPLFKPSVSFCQLTDNRAVVRNFIALLRFSFDSPSYIDISTRSPVKITHSEMEWEETSY